MTNCEGRRNAAAGWDEDRLRLRLKELLCRLTAIPGVAGFEDRVAAYMAESLRDCADEVTSDPMGNVFAVRRGCRPGPKVMVASHADEIGLVVKSIDERGFLRFEKLGGLPDPILPGRMVTVGGHLGVIGTKPGHLQSEEDRSRVRPHSELFIDVGEDSAAGVATLGIRVGDPVAQRSELSFFANSDRFAGKAVDDRLGCAVLLALFESLTGVKIAGTLIGAVTVQEEVGLRGATVAAYRVRPDLAIALDTMPCGDTPDVSFARDLPVGIGRGPAFQVVSGGAGGRGLIVNPNVRRLLEDLAAEAGAGYQVTTFVKGNTDATAMHLAHEGIPSGVIALPRRYAHSPVEMGDLRDAVGAWKILRQLALGIDRVAGYTGQRLADEEHAKPPPEEGAPLGPPC